MVVPGDRSRGEAYFDRLAEGRTEALEVFGVRDAAGSVRQVEISGTLIRANGSPNMLVIIGRDVTGRNGRESAL